AGHTIGDDLERVLAGAALVTQPADIERLVRPAPVELEARRGFDITDTVTAGVEHIVDRAAGEDLATDSIAAGVDVGDLGLDLQPIGQAVTTRQRDGARGGLDL